LKDQMKDRDASIPVELMLKNELSNGNMHFVQMTCHGKFEVSMLDHAGDYANKPQFDVLYSSHAAARAMTGKSLAFTFWLERTMTPEANTGKLRS
jgi:mannosyl-oligosaccharide glucosidase